MRKRGAKIRHARAAPPTMVALHVSPEVNTSERIAVMALTQPWGDTAHFNVLLDCHGMLVFGGEAKQDHEAVGMARFGNIALASIRERWLKTKKVRATGEEQKALLAMVDYSEDFWARTSGTLFADAAAALDKLRNQQQQEKAA